MLSCFVWLLSSFVGHLAKQSVKAPGLLEKVCGTLKITYPSYIASIHKSMPVSYLKATGPLILNSSYPRTHGTIIRSRCEVYSRFRAFCLVLLLRYLWEIFPAMDLKYSLMYFMWKWAFLMFDLKSLLSLPRTQRLLSLDQKYGIAVTEP